MARLETRDETYFTTVRGMCRQCRRIVPARVFFRDGGVWQQGLCPTCRCEPALIAADRDWYLTQMARPFPDRAPLRGAAASQRGCPHDCGPCAWHASPCQLPVLSITNACNLRCPICFTYNRREPVYHMSPEELGAILDWIVASSGPVDLINLTGGEPTLHPRLVDLLRLCRRPEIGRVTMNSNGLRLAKDVSLCHELAELGVHVILSMNTLDPAVSVRLHGRDLVDVKLRAIDNLTRAGAKLTLLNVMIRGENEDAAAGLLELLRTNPSVLSLTVQTMVYTGQGGGKFPQATHIPVDEAARIVAGCSGGRIRFADFTTRPSAHPLCYLTCYLVQSGDSLHPLARLTSPGEIEKLLADSYLIRPGASDRLFRDAVDRLYAEGREADLAVLRGLVDRLFPSGSALNDFQRQQVAESAVRTIYVHAHMDEDTLDCSRAMLCPDLVPASPGRLIPACTYNLFYRREDPRFFEPDGAGADCRVGRAERAPPGKDAAMDVPPDTGAEANPKSEARNPKETRSSKSEAAHIESPITDTLRFAGGARSARPTLQSRPTLQTLDTQTGAGIARGAHTLGVTHSACDRCGGVVPAKVTSDGGEVFFDSFCVEHGSRRSLVHGDLADYLASLRYVKPAWEPKEHAGRADLPCPEGCGICTRHEQHLCMPIVEITSRCDMDCPVCLVDAGRPWDMSLDEFRAILDRLIRAERQIDVLNFSGGEPLVHPQLVALLDEALGRPEIVRVSISTNGLRLLSQPELLAAIRQRHAVVSLQFDGFDDRAYEILRGRKMAAQKRQILDLLAEHDVSTSLTVTAAGGVNEHEFPAILDYFFAAPHVVSMMIQPAAFVGRGQTLAGSASRLTIPDVVRLLAEAGTPRISVDDFTPVPCGHPLCVKLAYYLALSNGRTVSIRRLIDAPRLLDSLANRTVVGLEEQDQQTLKDLVYELWSAPVASAPEGEAVMKALRGIVDTITAGCGCIDPRRMFLATERQLKSIYIHAFQDAETFDLARVRRCCHGYPQPDGSSIPACVHNVLRRRKR